MASNGDLGHFQAEGAVWPKLCWKLCRLWSSQFIHTRGSKIAIQEIPTLTRVEV